MNYLLSIIDGSPHHKLPVTDYCTLGRASACEIQVIDPMLSRKHARIVTHSGETYIEDLSSANGTFVNGTRIQGRLTLRNGDEILLGSHRFIFNPDVEVHWSRNGDTLLVVADDTESTDGIQVLSDAPESLDPRDLAQIHQMTCEIAAQLELDRLLETLLDRFIDHFGADRGFILGYDRLSGKLNPLAIRADKRPIAVSSTLLDRVIDLKKPILIHDALEEVSFSQARSIVEHGLRSVMLVPLMSDMGVEGLAQLDKKIPGAYAHSSLAQLSLLAPVAALAIRNASRFDRLRRKTRSLVALAPAATGFVGNAPQVGELLAKVDRAARSSARILITGESGTGKELIARMIHERGQRSEGPWVAVNCAATPDSLMESELFGHEKGAFTGATQQKKGCFERANQGTLFLDEIGEITSATQIKLLRVLQEGTFFRLGGQRTVQVDVRVVAATNRNLEQLLERGSFRQDLYFRLNVIHLETPSLRDRPEDIETLACFFLERFAKKMGRRAPELSIAAIKHLRAHPWPGNVRELKNAMERITVLCERQIVEPSDMGLDNTFAGLPTRNPRQSRTLQEIIGQVERRAIVHALGRAGGKKAGAARLLNISRPTLDKKIREYNVELDS